MSLWEKQKGSFANAAKIKAQEERQAAYDKEYISARKKAYAREAKEQLRREGLSNFQRKKEDFKSQLSSATKAKNRVAADLGSTTGAKDQLYKNLGGNVKIKKDALGRLKQLGKR